MLEWGLAMRIWKYASNSLCYKHLSTTKQSDFKFLTLEKQIARAAGLQGVIEFSSVVDINNNPKNPVIGYRSFGMKILKNQGDTKSIGLFITGRRERQVF